MNRIIDSLEETGLDVREVKVIVRCKRCSHEWALRVLPSEIRNGVGNPHWAQCWVCRHVELNDMGHDGVGGLA